MSENQELTSKLQLMLQKATRSLDAAQELAKKGFYDFASSRAYYAAFYAMKATLLTKDLSPSKHSGVIRLFNQYFIAPKTLPVEFSKFIGRLFRERQTGDYVFEARIDQAAANQDIQMAEQVVQVITDYLTREGFLPDD